MPESPFGKPFDDLTQMLEGVTVLADFNKAVYQAHIVAGFSPDQSMELTKHTFDSMIGPFIAMTIAGNV